MRRRFLSISAITVMTLAVRVHADDAADAKNTAIEFFRSLASENNAFIDLHFVGGTTDQKLLNVFRDLVRDGNALRVACTKRFGDEATKAGIDTFDPSKMANDIGKFESRIVNGTAQLRRPDSPENGLVMALDNGVWKVQSLTSSPGKSAQLAGYLSVLTSVITEVTRSVDAGNYKSIDEVRAALNRKQQVAMHAWIDSQAAPPTSQPAH